MQGLSPDITAVVKDGDFGGTSPTAFVIGGERQGYDLCVLKSEWDRVRSDPGCRGTTPLPLGIVAGELIVDPPPFREL